MLPATSVGLRRRSLFALAFAGSSSGPSRSQAATRHDLRVVTGPPSQHQADVLTALRSRFERVLADADPRALLRGARPTAYVALGAEALQAALGAPLDAPVVSLFASRQAFERATRQGSPNPGATAIHAEPSPDQQMRLIASLYKRQVVVGMLISPQAAQLEPLLRQAASDNGLRLQAVHVEPGAGLTRSLNRLGSVTVLLIQPDSTLFTQASLRELLESTYRRRLPVIGFSAELVRAGTLASAHSSIDDTLEQLGRLLDPIAAGQLPPPRYPSYWRVAVNDNVARSLDIVVDDETRRLGARP